eukprot:4502681-Pyramimonas_sp.AAC.1
MFPPVERPTGPSSAASSNSSHCLTQPDLSKMVSARARMKEGKHLFFRGHLAVHKVGEPSDFSSLCAADIEAFDGFLPVTVRLRGCTFVIIVYYGICGGIAGEGAQRLVRLGAFVRALQLPWIIIGDFNVSPAVLAKSGFIERVQ